MDSKQSTLISLGVLSLGVLIYYFQQCGRKRDEYQRKIDQFNLIFQQQKNHSFKRLQQILNTDPTIIEPKLQQASTQKSSQNQQTQIKNHKNLQKLVCFIDVEPEYNPSTFRLYERQRSIIADKKYRIPRQIREHQMGGDFKFKFNLQSVKCKLNDFNVSTTLFQQQKQDVHIFKGQNKVQPLVCSVTTTLKPFLGLSMFGKLYFDQNKMEWTLQPVFLTERSQLLEMVQKFYSDKKIIKLGYKVAIFVAGVVIAYHFLFKPIRSFINRREAKKKGIVAQNQIDFFKNKQYIMVKGSSLLNCQKCNTKNVQIIYQCGHLSLCKTCHEDNRQKLCPLCKKQSHKFMKIFMA